jgi:hypothetical protein
MLPIDDVVPTTTAPAIADVDVTRVRVANVVFNVLMFVLLSFLRLEYEDERGGKQIDPDVRIDRTLQAHVTSRAIEITREI